MFPHLLGLLVGLPLLAAFVVFFLPRQWVGSIRNVTTFAMVVELGLSLCLLAGDYASGDYAAVERHGWVYDLGIAFDLGVDGVSLFLVLLTTVLAPIALQLSFLQIDTKLKEWASSFLLLEAGLVGAFLARDLFLFYVSYELVLLPMYLFIGMWGSGERAFTTNKFFLYTLAGSLVMFIAVLYIGVEYAAIAEHPSFLVTDLARLSLSRNEQIAVALAFLLGFGIKMPLFPLHTWSPETYRDAPTGAAIVLSAVLAKLGSYGILRFVLPLAPVGTQVIGPTIAVFAVIGILYGAYVAWSQADLKTFLAYSSLSHMGFVVLGLFALTATAVTGSVVQMVSHGITVGGLFLVVGFLERRKQTSSITAFGGLAKVAPWLSFALVVIAMGSIAVPGTNGFVGELLILLGTFFSEGLLGFGTYGRFFAAFASLGVVFGAVYTLHALRVVVFGPTSDENAALRDLDAREAVLVLPLALLVLVLGLFPAPMTSRIEPAVTRLLETTSAGFDRARTATETTLAARPAEAPAAAPPPTAPTPSAPPPGVVLPGLAP